MPRRYDPQVRATEILRGPRRMDSAPDGFFESMVELAMKQTGMTRAQVEREAERLREARVEEFEATKPQRPTREQVAARGVPELHLANVYDREPATCDALQAVRRMLEGTQILLVLSGGVGTRKTGSACWALTQKPGTFSSANDAIAVSASKIPEDVARWRRLRSTQLLVLDDIGGEYSDDKGFRAAQFNALFDERYSQRLKTIVTTNLDAKSFRSQYGDRVADRIREFEGWKPIGGESVRREIAKARAGDTSEDDAA